MPSTWTTTTRTLDRQWPLKQNTIHRADQRSARDDALAQSGLTTRPTKGPTQTQSMIPRPTGSKVRPRSPKTVGRTRLISILSSEQACSLDPSMLDLELWTPRTIEVSTVQRPSGLLFRLVRTKAIKRTRTTMSQATGELRVAGNFLSIEEIPKMATARKKTWLRVSLFRNWGFVIECGPDSLILSSRTESSAAFGSPYGTEANATQYDDGGDSTDEDRSPNRRATDPDETTASTRIPPERSRTSENAEAAWSDPQTDSDDERTTADKSFSQTRRDDDEPDSFSADVNGRSADDDYSSERPGDSTAGDARFVAEDDDSGPEARRAPSREYGGNDASDVRHYGDDDDRDDFGDNSKAQNDPAATDDDEQWSDDDRRSFPKERQIDGDEDGFSAARDEQSNGRGRFGSDDDDAQFANEDRGSPYGGDESRPGADDSRYDAEDGGSYSDAEQDTNRTAGKYPQDSLGLYS